MYVVAKKILQCLAVCLAAIAIVVAPNEIRAWLDLLHDHIGPTTLFITALALISIQDYPGYTESDCHKPMLKRSCLTAGLCPAVGTIGTLVPLTQANVSAELIAHAIHSTLYGLTYLVIFNFLTRGKLAHLDDVPWPAFNNVTAQQQPNQTLNPPDSEQFERHARTSDSVNQTVSTQNNQQYEHASQRPEQQQNSFFASEQLQFQQQTNQ